MSSNNFNKNENRDKEKEELLQRLRQIEKEEVEEQQHEVEQVFLIQPEFFIATFDNNENNENVDINPKVKRKKLKIYNIDANISNKFEDEKDENQITFKDKTFLDIKQENLAKEILLNHANNNNLYIFPSKYDPESKKTFIFLNLPEDKESFQEFIINNHNAAHSNQHGIMDFNIFKVYYTNTQQSVPQIINKVTSIFINSGFSAVKMQLRFGVIWEGFTIEVTNLELISEYTSRDWPSSSSSSSSSLMAQLETKRRYYPQNVYQTNFQKYPLLVVTYQTYMKNIKPSYLINSKISRVKTVITVKVS
jgi:hypothetical protein